MKSLQILKNPNFLMFFSGQFLSRIGNSIATLGYVWLMHTLTHSTFYMSLVLAADFVPRIIFAPIAGSLVDRWSKRTTMILSDAGRGLLTLLLALLISNHAATPIVIITVALVIATLGTIFTPAYAVLQKQVVTAEELLQANSLQQLTLNVSQIAGPAIAGFIIAISGLGVAFMTDAVTFAVSVISLLLISVAEPERIKKTFTLMTVRDDTKHAAKLVAAIPQVKILTPSMLMYNFAVIAIENLLIVQFVADVLHRGTGAIGLINASMAVGELVGSLLLSTVTAKFAQAKLLVTNMMIAASCVILTGFSKTVWEVSTLFFIAGFCMSIVNVAFFTSIQEAVPSESLGSIWALIGAVFTGVIPVSQILFGSVAVWLPVGPLISGLGALGVMASAGAFLHPSMRHGSTKSDESSSTNLS